MPTRPRKFAAAAMLSVVMILSAAPARSAGQVSPRPAIERIIRTITGRATTRPATTRPTTRPAGPKADTIDACGALYAKGRYAAAAGGFRKLMSKRSLRVSAAVGLARALSITGKYDEALKALTEAEQTGSHRADWNLAMAEALGVVGRYREALAHAATACRLRPTWAPPILVRGRLLETVGRKKDAIAVYKSMEAVIDEDKYRGDARSLVALGMILDRYAVLTGRKASEQAGNILQNYFQKAYMDVDKEYWPAQVATGMFLLSKYRPAKAVEKFKLAQRINKHIPDAFVGMGVAELGRWRFDRCMRQVAAALRVNPRHSDALLLKGLCLMQWRKFEQVPPVCEEILKTNPNHLDALSLMAAVHICMRRDDRAKPYIERVGKINDTYSGLPNMIGQWLAAGRQYDQAEKYYKRAMALGPELAGPATNLGCLYMQSGDEDRARSVLIKARRIDDFRADIRNYLSVLDELETFAVKETEHFIVKVSAEHDQVLLDRVSAYMESIYGQVCGDYDHEPAVKTLIEIFPSHASFSKRISGRGWIGTIGACTGRVIALVAPNRERSTFGTFCWPSVLRHEFTHTVTLSATSNRIPHWFTEACAVWQQPDRQSYDAVKKLVGAVRTGRLFPIRELNWGFVRPKRRGDRGLAYAQSEWINEFIIATKGHETIIEMLRGFSDGKRQEQVFKECLSMTEAQFDKAFGAWAKQQVRKWGFDPSPPPDLRKAVAAALSKPKDAAAQATLAQAQWHSRRLRAKAAKTARKALALDADNVKALTVLTMSLMSEKEHEQAIETASRLAKLDPTSHIAQRALAHCYLEKRLMVPAIIALEHLKLRRPMEPYSHTELAKIYVQLGRSDLALPNLMELHRRTMKDPQYARQIAEIYTARGQEDSALRYWAEVTHINPYEASAYKAMTEIHIVARRYERAVATAREMRLADPDSAESWTYVAIARYRFGKAAKDPDQLRKAREAAEKALKIDPNVPKAKDVLELVDRALAA